MALRDDEVERIKYELGFHVMTIAAEPYIGFTSLFTQLIQPYASAGASTTCATVVAAADAATPATLTLDSATGFTVGARIVLDVDEREETVTVQTVVSASDIVVLLTKAHSGTYPVTVEAGETIIREILKHIRGAKEQMGATFGTGVLKRVDEISFYDSGGTQFGALGKQLTFWREELASVINVPSMWSERRAAGGRMAVH